MPNARETEALPHFSTQEELDDLLLEGLRSGEPVEASAEFWAKLRERAGAAQASKQAELRKAS